MRLNQSKYIPITRPSISELEINYVNDAIRNGWGAQCYDYIYRFEKSFGSYVDTQYSHATSSCTGAIHLALMALGVKAGDEVIVPEITWIASVEPVLYIGAKPIFVDVKEDTWCIDPEKIIKAITPKTKAIIAVHLYGNLVEMDDVMAIANKFGIKVLEDAAEAIGSEYKGKKAGSIGDAGVFSFHGTKTVVSGEGGMLVTNEKDIWKRAKILNDHGRDPEVNRTFWMKEYGYKYKMSNLQAALGCAQIERVEALVEKKRTIFNWYKSLLQGFPCLLNPDFAHTKNSYWMPTIILNNDVEFNRDKFFSHMKGCNIDSRPFFYPLSSLPMFEDNIGNKVAYDIYKRAINLPSYYDLTKEDVEYVVRCLRQFFK